MSQDGEFVGAATHLIAGDFVGTTPQNLARASVNWCVDPHNGEQYRIHAGIGDAIAPNRVRMVDPLPPLETMAAKRR